MPNSDSGSGTEPASLNLEPQTETVAFSRRIPSPELGILTVRGELDISTSGQLQRELDALLASAIPRVEVDLAGVSFMDSSALGVLLGAHDRAVANGLHLALASPSSACVKVLGITGLDQVFELI